MGRLSTLASALMLAASLGGCKTSADGYDPIATVRADEAVEVPARELCANSCKRLDDCTPSLASTYGTAPDVLATRFAFDCPGECSGLEGPAKPEMRPLVDCLSLDSCEAYFACSTGEPPPAAAASFDASRTCDGVCGRVLSCREPDETVADEIESDCQLRCSNTTDDGTDRENLMACLDQRTCGHFLGCVERWRQGGDAGNGPPPGVSETCDQLCTHAIQCGAEEEGLSEAELAELGETMASTYMECAVQCEKDHDPKDHERFVDCLAQETCEEFQECSDAL